MKEIKFVLVVILAINVSVSNAQEQIHFKIGYKPGKIYHLISNASRKIKVNYLGPQSLLDDLKKKGDSAVRNVTQLTFYDAMMETSTTLNSAVEFDLVMTFNKIRT